MAKVLKPGKRRRDEFETEWWVVRVTKKVVGGEMARGLIGPRSLLLGGVVLAYFAWGVPHLRVKYAYVGTMERPTYVWCEYWGFQTFRVPGPECPIFVWRKVKQEGGGYW